MKNAGDPPNYNRYFMPPQMDPAMIQKVSLHYIFTWAFPFFFWYSSIPRGTNSGYGMMLSNHIFKIYLMGVM